MRSPDELVWITVRVNRGFRAKASIASKMLDRTVSDIVVEALQTAIAKAGVQG